MTLPAVIEVPDPAPFAPAPPRRRRLWLAPLRWWFRGRPLAVARRTTLLLLVLGLLYFGALGLRAHRIDDDLAFVPAVAAEGGSAAAAMAAGLLDREVNRHTWTPNDPWFGPDAFLDNTPRFQEGIQHAVAQFSIQLFDQIGRARGSSIADPDLERAAGFLQFPPDVWVIEPRASWMPTVPSEAQYRRGIEALRSYDARVSSGQAVFERRADALLVTLSRVAADLGSRTALIEREYQREDTSLWDTRVDDVFYRNKGMLYAYALLLGALGEDFSGLLADRRLEALWAQALDSLRRAAELHPAVVMNGTGDDSLFANHLVLQGFYIKRAILQIDEVARSLAV